MRKTIIKPVVMLSIDEAAKYLRVGRNTMQRLIAENKVRSIRMGPRLIRIRTDALDAYLAQMEK
jgi:excisionase family DNA binding protein